MKTVVKPLQTVTKTGRPRKVRAVSPDQLALWELVRSHPGKNTKQLRELLGDQYTQGYETVLRDRLFRLEGRKMVRHQDKLNSSRTVRERVWFALDFDV